MQKNCDVRHRADMVGLLSPQFGLSQSFWETTVPAPQNGPCCACWACSNALRPPAGTCSAQPLCITKANCIVLTSYVGQKRTSGRLRAMSALLPKADIGSCSRNVRFGPIAAVSRRSKNLLSKAAIRVSLGASNHWLLKRNCRAAMTSRCLIRLPYRRCPSHWPHCSFGRAQHTSLMCYSIDVESFSLCVSSGAHK